ncbi:MAG: class I SAM-dependent methyltransferase, partial [Comamonadaceae bacterium]|nr:class I SAM-dependent methyltransferase [Comamonadaceae bacterium]
MNLLHPASFMEPYHLTSPAPWAGHIPFASWLVAVQQPRSFVELGAYSGISYLAFCQAMAQQGLAARTYAIDTWEGDAHAGLYGNHIYEALKKAHDPHYQRFSTLLRMTFDAALPQFADGSIDLLHIDGLHTYEAVRHDFETWLPKLSERAVVLFHDSAVRQGDFGVYRLWAELAGRYPSFEFAHSNGLGVLLVGAQQPPALLELCQKPEMGIQAQQFFGLLGARLERRAEVLALQVQCRDAQAQAEAEKHAGAQRHQWIEQQDQTILALQREQQQAAQRAAQQLAQVQQEQQSTAQQLAQVQQAQQRTAAQLTQAQQAQQCSAEQLTQTQQELQKLYQSRSWRATASLRAAGRFARRLGVGAAWRLAKRARGGLGYVLRGDWQGLRARAAELRRESAQAQALARRAQGGVRSVGIMATPHTLYVAHLVARALQQAGLSIQVFDAVPPDFALDLYVVICPQMFKRLPPGEKRIAFQMEQSVSSRWFTPEYLQVLENSLAVWDYAQTNLGYLEGKGIRYPHTYWVPIGGLPEYAQWLQQQGEAPIEPDTHCDVLFYGDVNAPRRKALLQALGERFAVRIEGNLFGPALRRAVAGAKVVVNLHYYEGALLETTRIYECLALGVPVVSEASVDMAEHAAQLDGAVRFFPVGDAQAMLQAVAQALAQPPAATAVAQVVQATAAHFDFML